MAKDEESKGPGTPQHDYTRDLLVIDKERSNLMPAPNKAASPPRVPTHFRRIVKVSPPRES